MATIRLENITKRFGKITALKNLSFEVKDGEFFCILGPPGAGKTTTLRTIIGLEIPEEGNVFINELRVNTVHPSKRDIAMIFQNLALYPDKTVFENIASPLRSMELGENEIGDKVTAVAKQLRIDWMLNKLPGQLSGGERQRVAIGRAIVRKPRAYLMDEPLANLDALLRLEMRVSLKELQTSLKDTFVYVTHDQVEALSMADRIAILDRGSLQQLGDPEGVYLHPNNMFVAGILGNPSMNFLPCSFRTQNGRTKIQHDVFTIFSGEKNLMEEIARVAGEKSKLMFGVRPEDVSIHFEKPQGKSIGARIYITEPLGNKTIVDIKLGNDVIKTVEKASFSGRPEQDVWVKFKETKLHLFNGATGNCIFHASRKKLLQIA
jgi:multiple sugar transport system ATP-binding protein